jgi:hypothetical protein
MDSALPCENICPNWQHWEENVFHTVCVADNIVIGTLLQGPYIVPQLCINPIIIF